MTSATRRSLTPDLRHRPGHARHRRQRLPVLLAADAGVPRRGQDRLAERLSLIRGRVSKVVSNIRERAADARIFLVGYPQLLPDSGARRGRLPLAKGDYA